jgi:hypothetical protein
MELKKQHLFVFTRMIGKMHILHDLKGSSDKLGVVFDKVMQNLELVGPDLDGLLAEFFPDRDLENISMFEYLSLINTLYVENKAFFTEALGGLTGPEN